MGGEKIDNFNFADISGSNLHFGRHHLSYPGANSIVSKRNFSPGGPHGGVHVWCNGQSGLHYDAGTSLRKIGLEAHYLG